MTRTSTQGAFGDRLIDDRHRNLLERLIDWCEQSCSGGHPLEDHLPPAFESSTFVRFCTQPESTVEEMLDLAKYTVMFFLADAASTQALQDFVRFLDGSTAPRQDEFVIWFRALVSEMDDRSMRTVEFQDAVRDLCAGMLDERAIRPPMSSAEYFALRRRTIAGEPYYQCWLAQRSRELTDRDARVWASLAIGDLTKDIMGLVNDLGSLDRDLSSSGPLEMNYLTIKEDGSPLASRVEAAIALANTMIAQAQNRLHIAAELSIALSAPALADHVDFFTWYLNGNTSATIHLVHRYPGATSRLNRIERLDHVL